MADKPDVKRQPKRQPKPKPKKKQSDVVTIPQGVGAGLQFHPDESNPTFAQGTYELPIQKILAQHLTPGDVFYDIGANIGFFSTLAARLVGKLGQVYAFEPVSKNAARIRRNGKLNQFSQIKVFEKAVSQNSGKGNLLLAQHSGGATLSTVGTPPDMAGSVQVDLISIDDWINKKKVKPPSLVKIDVEGAELQVIQGMLATIRTFKPILLYEVDAAQLGDFQKKQEELDAYVKDLGYQIAHLEAAYDVPGWHIGHAIAIPAEPSE
ncbi:FkbM family methyltransferase [Leptothoe spongobia TAU-MAC 1115]|uniref:FkbM family methyltransferase n=2 Tax=Leptothoe TaxID=2651725 RepID=A0A947GHY1_9CYAN|nr:FkbM family methyltransferase [Leptothoe spongobia TAU-MAC 1115]